MQAVHPAGFLTLGDNDLTDELYQLYNQSYTWNAAELKLKHNSLISVSFYMCDRHQSILLRVD